MSKNLLIVFVKNPELGKCKTRLAASIGDEKALIFYKNMLRHTKQITDKVSATKAIYYSSFIDTNDLWPENAHYQKHLQSPGELGEKMQQAFEEGFKAGFERICIIGSDCYTIDEHIIDGAFRALENKKAIIGPSTDGGYYLLGMNEMISALFTNKNWSTDSVTKDTLDDLERLQHSYELLTALTDVDTLEDLETIAKEQREALLQD